MCFHYVLLLFFFCMTLTYRESSFPKTTQNSLYRTGKWAKFSATFVISLYYHMHELNTLRLLPLPIGGCSE